MNPPFSPPMEGPFFEVVQDSRVSFALPIILGFESSCASSTTGGFSLRINNGDSQATSSPESIDSTLPTTNCKSTLAWTTSPTAKTLFWKGEILSSTELFSCLSRQSGIEIPLEYHLALERELQSDLFQSEDAKEGIASYVERRTPRFSGK